MSNVRFGIVGAGMVAEVIANAIGTVEGAELAALASRRPEYASSSCWTPIGTR